MPESQIKTQPIFSSSPSPNARRGSLLGKTRRDDGGKKLLTKSNSPEFTAGLVSLLRRRAHGVHVVCKGLQVWVEGGSEAQRSRAQHLVPVYRAGWEDRGKVKENEK